MTDQIKVETRDRVMVVTISRPEKKNALTQQMYGTMADAIAAYESSDQLRAFVLTGCDGVFTAGNDLGDFGSPSGIEKLPVERFLEALPAAKKPLVAAVNGPAIGIGLTMLLHFDVVFAARSANFRAPFVQLGVVPEAASSLLLPATVGMAMANDILLTGRVLDADEALKAGLVSRVLQDAELMPLTLEIATRIADSAPNSMRRSKALIRGAQADVAAQMSTESKQFAIQLASEEFAECAQAMADGRKPTFQ